MTTVTKQVEVSKEASELSDSVVTLVASIKKHGEDGFQAGEDIPAIVLENLQSLMKGIEGVNKLGDEAKQNLAAFINAWTLGGTEIASMFLVKDDTSA